MGYAATIVNAIRCARSGNCNHGKLIHKFNSVFHQITTHRSFHASSRSCRPHKHPEAHALDPRLEDLGNVIQDEYAIIRDNYG